MQYPNITPARFIRRVNRFVATVLLDGHEETVHVKNTGRCRELLLPDAQVYLCRSDDPNRKTRYDLVSVEKPGLGCVNIDSQAPNRVVLEWLRTQSLDLIRPEYPFGASRLDFYLESGGRRLLLEVKGCTLERDGVGYFPDAPTLRGAKHLRELAAAAGDYECAVAFAIQMPGITEVLPNTETDPGFAQALLEAKQAGVRVLCLPCSVTPDSLSVRSNLQVFP